MKKLQEQEILEILEQHVEIFRTSLKFPQDIEIEIILCNSTEELYQKRCELTIPQSYKNILLHNKNKYINAAGCYIYPPVDKKFIILLLSTSNVFYDCYNFAHELSHIYNFLKFYKNNEHNNIMDLFQKQELILWDEYNARYISTCIIIDMFKATLDIEDISKCMKTVCDVLRKYADNKNIYSYDGVQLLGAVEAIYEKGIINNLKDYLSLDEISTLNYFKTLQTECF